MLNERKDRQFGDEAELELQDFGDATEETMQTAPIPRFGDNAYGFGFHPN